MPDYSLRIKAPNKSTAIRYMPPELDRPIDWDAIYSARLGEPANVELWITTAIGLAKDSAVSMRTRALLLRGRVDALASEDTAETLPDGLKQDFALRLSMIAHDLGDARRKLRPETILGMRDVLILPAVMISKRQHRLVHQVVCKDLCAALCYATSLLIDKDVGLGERLRQCPHCEKFFFKSVKLRRYCSKECMRAADAADNWMRVDASRRGMKIGEWKQSRYARKERKRE